MKVIHMMLQLQKKHLIIRDKKAYIGIDKGC